MSFRARGSTATQVEINRVAIISQQELADSSPDLLCLLKRLVNDFDELEVSDEVDWATRVDAIATDKYKKIFQGGAADRLRFRYSVYGYSVEEMQAVFDELETAFGP